MALYLDESQVRNFNRWPIMGTFVHPNPTPVPATYADEITNLKDWLWQRLTWLDANMPGVCDVGIAENMTNNVIRSYPNPFLDDITVSFDVSKTSMVKIELLNTIGERVKLVYEGSRPEGNYQENINASGLAKGLYLIKLTMNNKSYYQKVIKM
ncbi:MAG: T9SS type A sorting domain-containing protein [Bacteroidetes bacterium]|nr:T9SS type A sorting domain-containing protein [Bacteroidota bacterium]